MKRTYLESILYLGSSLDPSKANFIVAVLGSSPTSGNLNSYPIHNSEAALLLRQYLNKIHRYFVLILYAGKWVPSDVLKM